MDGMSRFLGAGMELVHLDQANFAVLLQVIDLNVAGEERDHVGGAAVGDLHQALDRKNRTG